MNKVINMFTTNNYAFVNLLLHDADHLDFTAYYQWYIVNCMKIETHLSFI